MEKPSVYEPVPQHDGTDSIVEDQEDTLLFRQNMRGHRWVSCLKYGAILGLFFFAYTFVVASLTLNVANNNRRIGQRFLKTPVDNDYIVYEPHVMEQWEDRGGSPTTYFAEPSEQVDRHWHDLFQYQNIGVDPELMRAMGREGEGIKLPDGTYYGSIMVFHHLHCIKNLYHALNPEYYGVDNMTVEEKASWKDHTTHCLHMLKEAVMCQGDTTVLTMMWADYRLRPIGNLTAPHECINWDRLMQWVKPNSRDLTIDGYLVHPKFGPVVVDGHLGNGPIS